MSRGYRIRTPAPQWRTTTTTASSEDSCAMDVGVLEILPEAEMLELLRGRLAEEGWKRDADGGMSRSFGQVSARLTPDGRSVEAKVVATREVSARGVTDAEAKAQLRGAEKAAEAELARTASARLQAAEGDIRAAVQGALQKVYVEALQRKAAALGSVESVQETRGADGELELTIKVRV